MENLIHINDTCLSDLYKDAYGVRPRHYKELWSNEELEAEYEHLSKVCDANTIEEQEREDMALRKFEVLIADIIKMGAGDRETAIRWLVEGDGFELCVYDLEYFFWSYGLSYEIQKSWGKKYSKKSKVFS